MQIIIILFQKTTTILDFDEFQLKHDTHERNTEANLVERRVFQINSLLLLFVVF